MKKSKATWAVSTNSPKFSFPCLRGVMSPFQSTVLYLSTSHPSLLTLNLTSLLAKLFANKKQHQRHPGKSGSAMLFLHCLCLQDLGVPRLYHLLCPHPAFHGRQIPGAINTQSSSWWRINLPFYCLWLEGCLLQGEQNNDLRVEEIFISVFPK